MVNIPPYHIIVIGTGLAGLTAAISLSKAGHNVEIVEAAPAVGYIGAGIQISPNSSRVLRKLGVDKYIQKYCLEPIDLKMMSYHSGNVLVETPLKEPALQRYGSPYWHIHRADLHRGLLEAAIDLGVKVYLDNRVVDIDPYKPSLVTKTGAKFTADLIVASDGLWSIARAVVLGKPSPPVPTGQMCFRITVPTKKLEGLTGLDDLITVARNNHWFGPNGTMLTYLLEGVHGTMINLVLTCDARMPDGVNQRISSKKEAKEAFKDWDPRILKILDYADEVLEWRLFTHKEAPTWIHESNKLVLIGDAAHAMTPYLAQGSAMGIEDSAILGGVLARLPTPDTLPQALKLYEKLRVKRTAKVTAASIDSRWFTQMPDGPEQKARDEYLLANPGIMNGHKHNRSDQQFLDDLFGYNAFDELDKAFKEAVFRSKRPISHLME
ncbi:FAD/NAD(P)-binding domain-containing protein [Rhizodiscina lignyota]|uniref:FAD/NAD(P)-binding domain-containing protein n=1 Tax=Rhizodiscina lignyota TaxID=1504668 RepID=A0A9P4M3T1_9PEZI|nr:FAD/NAD(P)-binding domain-containing protein [Rhizodiscina lignyota]